LKQRSVIERELGGAGAVGADEGSIQDILEFRCPPAPCSGLETLRDSEGRVSGLGFRV
jgi:hypothetical protein